MRDAEKLTLTDAAKVIPTGFFKITMKIAPNFAIDSMSTEQGDMEYNLLFVEGKTHLYLTKTDRKLNLKVEDVVVASDPLSFSREEELTITAESTDKGAVTLTVAGADAGNGTFTGPAAPPIDTSKGMVILGKDMGAEECADLRYIKFE